MICIIQIVGLYFSTCVRTEIVVARGLRVVILLTGALMLIYWPFGTYINFYHVNFANNLLLIFTMPSLIQASPRPSTPFHALPRPSTPFHALAHPCTPLHTLPHPFLSPSP